MAFLFNLVTLFCFQKSSGQSRLLVYPVEQVFLQNLLQSIKIWCSETWYRLIPSFVYCLFEPLVINNKFIKKKMLEKLSSPFGFYAHCNKSVYATFHNVSNKGVLMVKSDGSFRAQFLETTNRDVTIDRRLINSCYEVYPTWISPLRAWTRKNANFCPRHIVIHKNMGRPHIVPLYPILYSFPPLCIVWYDELIPKTTSNMPTVLFLCILHRILAPVSFVYVIYILTQFHFDIIYYLHFVNIM